jgi:thiol-disulfide isomerase/thioredoxin
MVSKWMKILKKNPFQVVVFVFLAGYIGVMAFTGACPMQLAADSMGGQKLAKVEGAGDGYNLHASGLSWELVDGSTLQAEALAGKVTVVNYWATWCGPCVREIPAFNKVANELEDEVVLVGISLDRNVSAVHQFLQRQPIDYPIAHGDLRLTQFSGTVNSIPTTLFFDSRGQYAGKVVGAMSEQQLKKKIRSL